MHTKILVGAGGHAKVVYSAVTRDERDSISVVDGNSERVGELFMGEVEISLMDFSSVSFHVAIGSNEVRNKIFQDFVKAGGKPWTILAESAQISEYSDVQGGVFCAALSIVGPETQVGCGTIINHCAIVDHDCEVGQFCHIAPNATLGGGVKLEDEVLVGAGATILPGLTVGEKAIIGAGAVVTSSVEAGTVVKGIPAVK